MIIEELAYHIEDIKSFTIRGPIIKSIKFKNEMAYLKNNSSLELKFSVTNVASSTPHNQWGVTVQDDYYTMAPGEIVGPLFLEEMFFQGSDETVDQKVIVIVQGRR